jgi:hypothetical protein
LLKRTNQHWIGNEWLDYVDSQPQGGLGAIKSLEIRDMHWYQDDITAFDLKSPPQVPGPVPEFLLRFRGLELLNLTLPEDITQSGRLCGDVGVLQCRKMMGEWLEKNKAAFNQKEPKLVLRGFKKLTRYAETS